MCLSSIGSVSFLISKCSHAFFLLKVLQGTPVSFGSDPQWRLHGPVVPSSVSWHPHSSSCCWAARQASLSFTISRSLPKPMSIESVMPSNHLILCRPLLLPSIFPSIRVFSNELAFHIRWPDDWSFSFSISPSSEHSGLISFRMDWHCGAPEFFKCAEFLDFVHLYSCSS